MTSLAPGIEEIAAIARELAALAGFRAVIDGGGVDDVLVRFDSEEVRLNVHDGPDRRRSVWHGAGAIDVPDCPHEAELAIGDLLDATDGYAASAIVLARARDGHRGQGPVDAFRLGGERAVRIGGRWICQVERLETQHTRCSLVSVRFSSRLAVADLQCRLAESPRLRRLPAWADVKDTAALAEVMSDPDWQDDLMSFSTLLSIGQDDLEAAPAGVRRWKAWMAAPPGATALAIADLAGRLSEPETPASGIRLRTDRAARERRHRRFSPC